MIVNVTEIEHYTDSLFRIKTERPKTFRFTAGEFVMIGLEGTPKRAYSLTSGPYDEYLEFYSIKVPDGPLTSKLQHIKIGDELIVGEKPTGTLTLANLELGGNLWLLATGTGIAPFISLLRDPTTYDHFDDIHVYWSVRKAQELQAAGLTQAQARQLFQEAQRDVPRIQELQQRGGEEVAEDDLFDVEDFTEATVFRTPDQLEEIRILEAEEETRFTPLTVPARRGGRVTGLTQQ